MKELLGINSYDLFFMLTVVLILFVIIWLFK